MPDRTAAIVDRALESVADPPWLQTSEYRVHRERALHMVIGVLEATAFPGAMSGSWARGDYHLSRDGTASLSDLDLVLTESTLETRRDFVDRIEDALVSSGLALPVSIHPSQSFEGMPLADQFHFNLLELLIWPSHQSLDYAVAKAALMLSRNDLRETGLEAGAREGLWASIRVKLGVEAGYLPDGRTAETGALVFGGLSLEEWMGEPHLGLGRLATFFGRRLDETGQWIYGHAAAKARRGSRRDL